ncbi:MAG: helix-turn-helix domain-containing protein [Bacilli bacterium]|jgi:transcriptional regulator with XRE-family HTH domain|nr:helix-turn-helix domain-containing protein [Bacilli bacterium]
MTDFSTIITSIQEATGLSNKDFAKQMGVSAKTLWAYEHRGANPRWDRAEAIFDNLGLDLPGLLLSGSSDKWEKILRVEASLFCREARIDEEEAYRIAKRTSIVLKVLSNHASATVRRIRKKAFEEKRRADAAPSAKKAAH